MDRNDYKRVIGKLEPDAGFEARLAGKLQGRSTRRWGRLAVFAAGCAVVVLCVGLLAKQFGGSEAPGNNIAIDTPNRPSAEGSVWIPKIELPTQSAGKAQMIGLIVYKGKVYTQSGTQIAPAAAKRVVGDRIGRTKASINEWSKQDDYATELASSVGTMDVFTVRGYDSNFRIMTYEEHEGEIWAEYYECLNGIEIKSGADVFNALNLAGHLQSAQWEKFESWDNNKQAYNELQLNETLLTFVQALYEAKPLESAKLQEAGIFDNGEQTQKFLLLQLNDGSVTRLRLFKDGYVMYGFAHVFFKVEDAAFAKLWNLLT